MPRTLQIEISDELYGKLEALAADMGRSIAEVQMFALEDFVEHERGGVDSILQGIKDCEDGRGIPQEEVAAWVESKWTANPLPRPEVKGEPLGRAS